MRNFRSYDRSQRLLLPPDLKDWVHDDDLAHFICEAVERIEISHFHVSRTGSGIAQYHPRMMLALLIYCYANGVFASRRIERATYRDVSVRYIAANSHPDHDTIATFRRLNAHAFASAFEEVLMLASETGLLKVGTVSVDGTKLDANASKIKSVRYDRIQALRKKLAADIAELMEQAELADCTDADDGLSLPDEISRREALKAKLDAAAERLEEAAAEEHGDNDDGGLPPEPAPDKQTNLTDPDSSIMRKSARHEYRQAYNAQAIVDADGSQLVLATDVYSTTNDRHGFEGLVDSMPPQLGKPQTLVADSGYAGEEIVSLLEKRNIEALIAVSRQPYEERPYDFRPPPDKAKRPKAITTPWRLEMIKKLQTDQGKEQYRKRKSSVEPVFGIIKSAVGFTKFNLRGIEKVKTEWKLMTLAYNCKRISNMIAG